MSGGYDAEFEAALSQEIPRLRIYARRLNHWHHPAMADDLVQDTVEQALIGAHKFQPGSNMAAWLCTIMRHLHYHACKDAKLAESNLISLEDDGVKNAPEFSLPPNLSRLLLEDGARLLSLLSKECRDAVILTCVLGLTVSEAASQLSVTPGTVKSRVHRARLKMARVLDWEPLPPRAALYSNRQE